MATAYIQNINITTDGKVTVDGQLSSTNLSVQLIANVHIMPPEDGIWTYFLEVVPTSTIGATILVPFSVEAPWEGDADSNGVRIIQRSAIPGEEDKETIQLKGKTVKNFTSTQQNMIGLQGAHYDTNTQHLVVDVQYGGGCFPHQFSLEWDGLSRESFPPQYIFNIVDHSDRDPCKAIVNVQLRFDISAPDFQIDKPATLYITTPNSSGSRRVEIE